MADPMVIIHGNKAIPKMIASVGRYNVQRDS